MDGQLARMHNGIRRVVNKIKNKEIPSIPRVKFKFNSGTQQISSTNWKLEVDLSKKTHKKRDNKKVKNEKKRAVNLKNWACHAGRINNTAAPIKGKITK